MYTIEAERGALGYSLEVRQGDTVVGKEFYSWDLVGSGIEFYKMGGDPSYVSLMYVNHLNPEDADMLLKKHVREHVDSLLGDLDEQGIEARVIDSVNLFPNEQG